MGYVVNERSLERPDRFTVRTWDPDKSEPPLDEKVDVRPGKEGVYSFRSSSSSGPTPEEVILELSAGKRYRSTSLSDTGHEFRHFKSGWRTSHPRIFAVTKSRVGTTRRGYRGPIVQILRNNPSGDAPSALPMGERFLETFLRKSPGLEVVGSALHNAALPTTSRANLALTLAELKKDGLPNFLLSDITWRKIRGLRDQVDNLPRAAFRETGSDYLNFQFGIAPLVSDIKDLIQACLNANKIVLDFTGNGSTPQFSKTVRRTRSRVDNAYDEKRSIGSSQIGGTIMGSHTRILSQGTTSSFTTTGDKYKFVGAFQYKLPVNDTVVGQLLAFEAKANHLLGLRVTPATLYELTAFSWLIDWFSNLGDIISNASGYLDNGLVLKYGYIMRHRILTYHFRHDRALIENDDKYGGNLTVSPEFTWTHEFKDRQRAHPFGFGLKAGELSAYQLSILAALGISRA